MPKKVLFEVEFEEKEPFAFDAIYGLVNVPGCINVVKINSINTVLIEDAGKSPTEWGVSITSSNPESKDYFKCEDKDHALRLCALLEHA